VCTRACVAGVRVLQVWVCCRCARAAVVACRTKVMHVCMSHARSCPCARCECTIDTPSAPSIDQQPAVLPSTTTRSRSRQRQQTNPRSHHKHVDGSVAALAIACLRGMQRYIPCMLHVCFTRPCTASRACGCVHARQAGLPRCCERSTDASTHDEKIAVGHTPWR